MDFERFQDFMLQSAAKHDAEIAAIREALTSMSNTVGRLVDNQVYLQQSLDLLTQRQIEAQAQAKSEMQELRNEIGELGRIVFRHVSDPDAHRRG